MHGFQNYYAQFLSLRRRSAIQNICLRRLKVKVTLDGQMIKWSEIELVRDITCALMHCYVPNFEEIEGQIGKGLIDCPSIYSPHPPNPHLIHLNSLTLVRLSPKNILDVDT